MGGKGVRERGKDINREEREERRWGKGERRKGCIGRELEAGKKA